MTPDLPPVPPGRWLPRLEAARQLGITERTLQRRMKQGLVQTRHDEHNRVQVYVPDQPDTRHEQGHDIAMTGNPMRAAEAIVAGLHDIINAERDDFLARTTEQEAIIRQQAEELGLLRERLRIYTELQTLQVPRTTWWRVLWQRLSGEKT